MRSASSGRWPGPFRWSLWSTTGVASGLVVGFVPGLVRPRPAATSVAGARTA